MAGDSKTVLVEFQDHSRVVSFNTEESSNEALLYAAFPGSTGKVMGELAALLYVPFMVFLGYVLIGTGQYLYNLCGKFEEDGPWEKQDWICFDLEDWPSHMHKVYIYAGGITTLVFWSCVFSMWPFYRNDRPRLEDLERLTANMRAVLRMKTETELDSEQGQQRQQQPVYGSVEVNDQGSFSNGEHAQSLEAEGQLLPLESGVDGQQQRDDRYQNQNRDDQANQCQNQDDQYQNQSNQYQDDPYQDDQYHQDQNDQFPGDQQYQENVLENNHDQESQYEEDLQRDINHVHSHRHHLIPTESPTT